MNRSAIYRSFITGFFAILFSVSMHLANAQSSAPVQRESFQRPWFGQVQFGGNMGQISLGAGKYFFNDNFLLSLHYGQTNSDNEGVSTIHSYTLKNTFLPFRIPFNNEVHFSPEMGWAISSSGENHLPLLMFVGARIERDFDNTFFSRLGLYFHIGTTGMWLAYAADNSDIDLHYLYNLSAGLQVNF